MACLQSFALLIFALFTLAIIYAGVRNGIERVSKFMMPILVVLSLIITVYSVTRPGALEGVKYFYRSESEGFLLDDRCRRDGTDVLLPVHCDGYPRHLRILYEEGRFD